MRRRFFLHLQVLMFVHALLWMSCGNEDKEVSATFVRADQMMESDSAQQALAHKMCFYLYMKRAENRKEIIHELKPTL